LLNTSTADTSTANLICKATLFTQATDQAGNPCDLYHNPDTHDLAHKMAMTAGF